MPTAATDTSVEQYQSQFYAPGKCYVDIATGISVNPEYVRVCGRYY